MTCTKEDVISVTEELTRDLNTGMGRKLVGYRESSKFLFRYIWLAQESGCSGGVSEAGDLKQELEVG